MGEGTTGIRSNVVDRGWWIAAAYAGLTACAADPPTLSVDTETGSDSGTATSTSSVPATTTTSADGSGGEDTSTSSTGLPPASSSTGAVADSTDGSTSLDDGGSSSSGRVSTACRDVVTFEMMPSEATLTGGWSLGMSMLGEGEIAVFEEGSPGGSILYEPDIPCDDTWHIWVRAWDNAGLDSYFATLDGLPNPPAIFEGDCTGGSSVPYIWAALNWRDEAASNCVYVEDPWTPQWAAGVHQIEFSYRESQAMGRILLTNDPAFVPM